MGENEEIGDRTHKGHDRAGNNPRESSLGLSRGSVIFALLCQNRCDVFRGPNRGVLLVKVQGCNRLASLKELASLIGNQNDLYKANLGRTPGGLLSLAFIFGTECEGSQFSCGS